MAQTPRIVLTSGCFDVLHVGHVAFLEAARACGDELVVALTDDFYVTQQKGKGHPYFPLPERYRMLQALRVVDRVMISSQEDVVNVIRRVRPSVYAKGSDYAEGDMSGRLERERHAVESIGGALVILESWPVYSSTAIMKALA